MGQNVWGGPNGVLGGAKLPKEVGFISMQCHSPVHNGQIRKGIRVSFRKNGNPMPYLASDDARSLGYSL